MKKITLIVLATLTLAQADFSRSTAGVVTDDKTKLEWQDDYSASADDDDSESISQLKWTSALTYCNGLKLDGGGWRLPNINELKSLIVDKVAPTIDGKFDNTSSSYYWSSTSYEGSKGYAWIVYFGNGNVYYDFNKDGNYSYVRCVRAGE